VRQFTGLSDVKTLLTLLACVADGAIVGAVIGGLLGHWRKRRSALAHERERVRQRYVVLLNLGLNTPLSLSEQHEIERLSLRWCKLGLPQTPLGAPFPERRSSAAVQAKNGSPTLTNAKEPQLPETGTINLIPTIGTEQRQEAIARTSDQRCHSGTLSNHLLDRAREMTRTK
jgi:hypothetical protein